jgi:hypothetical protein
MQLSKNLTKMVCLERGGGGVARPPGAAKGKKIIHKVKKIFCIQKMNISKKKIERI